MIGGELIFATFKPNQDFIILNKTIILIWHSGIRRSLIGCREAIWRSPPNEDLGFSENYQSIGVSAFCHVVYFEAVCEFGKLL